MDYESVPKILQALKDAGFAADNIAFGSGGALLQKLNRDTFKCPGGHGAVAPRRGVPSNARRSTVQGEKREVFKEPRCLGLKSALGPHNGQG